MKTKPAVMIAVCMALTMQGFAQAAKESSRDDAREGSETVTDEQIRQVRWILSDYDAASLTAEKARAIHDAFREAGLRAGPAMADTIRAAGFDPDQLRELAPPPDALRRSGTEGGPPSGEMSGRGGDSREEEGRSYSVEQAISDRAQLHTIAFDGVAFLTGGMACNTFLPPGKVADFCGFQYMRDVDTNELGHNTSFVPRVANNVLQVLTAEQRDQLIALGREQEPLLAEFAYKRFPLIQAFHRQLIGEIAGGSAGLNRKAVTDYTADFYEIDGLLSYRRAEVLGSIVRALTDKQKAELAKMVFNDSSTWPVVEDQVDKQGLSHAAHVAVMTYASEMFSWYAGNVEADVYFCPERHGTYFGSFYMKDIPAMGDDDYSISTSLTGDSGEAFLGLLTQGQRKLVTSLVDQQRADLEEIVKVRREIATLLRGFMTHDGVDEEKVIELSRRYGELDGEISYLYAKTFAQVAASLTSEQMNALMKLRNLDPKYTPKGAFLYSAPIDMPEIPNTDFLFAAPATAESGMVSVATPAAKTTQVSFRLTSPEVVDGGTLPRDYTGDGCGATLPLQWTGAPEGTKSFALIMHHVAPDRTKWYWIVYNIPAGTTMLAGKVEDEIGVLGNNSVNGRIGYAPPHSKGPGAKTYIYTVYALSEPVTVDVEAEEAGREVLLAAMKGKILGTAELAVIYSRNGSASKDPPREDAR